MNTEQITTIILNILASGTPATLLLFIVRGLKREVQNLNKTIESQNKTLDVMERRIAESEKAGNIYKTLFDDLPDAVDKYNEIIQKTKNSVIENLDKANQSKDEKLKQVAELRLKEIDVVQPIVTELSTLNDDLHQIINEVQTQLRSLDNISHMTSTPIDHGTTWGSQMAELEVELAPRRRFSSRVKPEKVSGASRPKPFVPESGVLEYERKAVTPSNKQEDEKVTSEQPI